MKKTRKNFMGYPGDGYRLAICDLCGTKRHVKDMKAIDAEFNRFNGAFICKEHNRPTHPQDIPFTIEPDIVDTPETIRDRLLPVRMQTVNHNNQLPTAPRELRAVISNLGTPHIRLFWLGPQSVGSGPILGYRIEISVPQFVAYVVLNVNTGTSVPSYFDLQTPVTTICTYRVAAICALGLSPYSNDAPFPGIIDNTNVTYIAGDDAAVISGDDGVFLIEG